MTDLIIHGVPDGQEISKCDQSLRDLIGLFYDNSKGIKQSVNRYNNKVIYSYIVYANNNSKFSTYYGRPGSYFGMSLVFTNKCASDPNQIFKLLKSTYDNYVKNKIIQEQDNGYLHWMYPKVSTPGDEIAVYVSNGMNKILQNNPELNPKLQPLPPIQNQTQRY